MRLLRFSKYFFILKKSLFIFFIKKIFLEEKSHAKNEVDIQQRKANSEMTNELKRYETCVQYKWIEKKDPVIQMYKNFDAFCQNLKATELTGIAKEFNSARKARDVSFFFKFMTIFFKIKFFFGGGINVG